MLLEKKPDSSYLVIAKDENNSSDAMTFIRILWWSHFHWKFFDQSDFPLFFFRFSDLFSLHFSDECISCIDKFTFSIWAERYEYSTLILEMHIRKKIKKIRFQFNLLRGVLVRISTKKFSLIYPYKCSTNIAKILICEN